MSDISRINGGGGSTPYSPTVGIDSIPVKQGPSSGAPAQAPEDGGPLLGTDSTAEVPPEGDVPTPSGGSPAPSSGGSPTNGSLPPPIPDQEPTDKSDPWYKYKRAGWLENQIALQQRAQELRDTITSDPSSPEAAAALKELNQLFPKLVPGPWSDTQLEDAQNEFADIEQYGPNGDLTGSGILNKDNPDIDGDGLTNEAEIANHTNIFDQDSDHDGITDYGELWLKQHNYDYAGMDPNNPDSNHDGILDGQELPSSVRVDNNGRPIVVGGQPGSNTPGANTSSVGGGTPGGPGGPTGGAPTGSSYQWSPPSSGHQTVNATDGDKTVNAADGDVVFNGDGGAVDFSKSGNNLVIKTDKGTVTISGYYDASGKPVGKVYVEGTVGAITTSNGSNVFGATADSSGYATGGIHFASGIDTSGVVNNYDPFGGNGGTVDKTNSTKDTTVYEPGATGEFDIPQEINGQEVKAIEVTVDVPSAGDITVKCEGAINGDPLKTFVLKGAKADVQNGSIHFKLADNGQYFYCPDVDCTVDGGKGDDEITIKGGTARGNDGNDYLKAIDDAATLDGGKGDDYVIGGSGVDNLKGGEGDGMDFLFSGSSTGDTMDGGDGDDILIVGDSHTDATYNLTGGGGTDMTNSANPNVGNMAHGFEVTGSDPGGILSFIESHKDNANSDLLGELEKLHDPAHPGILDGAASDVSSTVEQAAMGFLVEKKKEFDAKYGGTHGAGFTPGGTTDPTATPPGGSTTPPGGSTTPPVTGQSFNFGTPGLMTESMSTTESRRRRNHGDEDFTDNGDIPSPMES